MTELNDIDKKHQKLLLKSDLESLHDDLQKCSPRVLGGEKQYQEFNEQIEQMIEQAEIMDKIMLRMIENAEKMKEYRTNYGLALRAQSQYRQTVMAIDALHRRSED